MRIGLYHASKFGNGRTVAEELQGIMQSSGHEMEVTHIRDAKPRSLPEAELYIFSSPTRLGKPIGSMRRFLRKLELPPGTRYALIATLGQPRPGKDGTMPPQEEIDRLQRNMDMMQAELDGKGLVKIAGMEVFVTDLKGPLEEGWKDKVAEFASAIGA